jgi:hypothetical protein
VEDYKNPVDGKTYVADWKKHSPEGPIKRELGPVVSLETRFLNTQQDVAANADVEELVDFTKRIESVLTAVQEAKRQNGEIMLQIELSKSVKPSFSLAHQGALTPDFLQSFYDSLEELPEFRTRKSSISFQVHFAITTQSRS